MKLYFINDCLYNGDLFVEYCNYLLKKQRLNIFKWLIFKLLILLLNLNLINEKKFKTISLLIFKKTFDTYINEFINIAKENCNKNVLDTIEKNDIIVTNYVTNLEKKFSSSLKLKLYDINDKKLNKFNFTDIYSNEENLFDAQKYMVKNGEIVPLDNDYIADKKTNKASNILFILFAGIYILLGLILSFNLNMASNVYDYLFESDCPRVFNDMTDIQASHARLSIHPLFVLLTQPVIFVLNSIFINKEISALIFIGLVGAFGVKYVYKFISLYNKTYIATILTLILGFSFSNLIFNAEFELYNIAAISLILLWYIVAKILNNKINLKKAFSYLIIIGIMTLGITITNYTVFLIASFILLLSKKVNFKYLFKLNIITILIFILLSFFQNFVWNNTPVVSSLFTNIHTEASESGFSDKSISIQKIKNVISDDFYNSIIASDVYVYSKPTGNKLLRFSSLNIITVLILSSFFLLLIYFFVRKCKKNIMINLGLILTLCFNTVFHIVYGNTDPFLYSQHFLYAIIFLFAVNYKNNKYTDKFLCIMLIYELIRNILLFLSIVKTGSHLFTPNYWLSHFGFIKSTLLYLLILIITLAILYYIYKNIRYRLSKKTLLISIICVFVLECFFISLYNAPKYNKLLFLSFNSQTIEEENNLTAFNNHFSSDIKSLNEYKSEYEIFIQKYNVEKFSEYEDVHYFLFGMGNRKKLIYKDGKIIDGNTKKTLYKWEVINYLIIPNDYSVILQTKDKQYIKIYEDNKGVHISGKKDFIIDGTDKQINLYSFSGEKFETIKRVLYQEILFNIKDEKIYPNIFVYDKPWYRDAAISAMVLKNTGNIDLIENWINNINEIYDNQNGEKEVDNLGELLYLLSLPKNKNWKMINKVIDEAENIASKNNNHLSGKTDFQVLECYQNLWYSLGIQKLGLKTDIKYNGTPDEYSESAWWSNIDINTNKKIETSPYFAYLAWAKYHKMHKGTVFISSSLYPLSYEKNASKANYENMKIIDKSLKYKNISPAHTWMASEILLFLMSETKGLEI